MPWFNLTMPNQTVKNALKAKKIKLPQMNVFIKKQFIKFSFTYWPLSLCKIKKKNSLGWSKVMRMCHFRAQTGPFVLKKKFFGANHYYFRLPIDPFHCAKFKKILRENPELWGCVIFWPKMVHLPQTKIIFGKLLIVNSTLIYLLAPLTVQNFEKIFPADLSYEYAQFLDPKWPIFSNENFFQKTC